MAKGKVVRRALVRLLLVFACSDVMMMMINYRETTRKDKEDSSLVCVSLCVGVEAGVGKKGKEEQEEEREKRNRGKEREKRKGGFWFTLVPQRPQSNQVNCVRARALACVRACKYKNAQKNFGRCLLIYSLTCLLAYLLCLVG